jgi:hypothetical protein
LTKAPDFVSCCGVFTPKRRFLHISLTFLYFCAKTDGIGKLGSLNFRNYSAACLTPGVVRELRRSDTREVSERVY